MSMTTLVILRFAGIFAAYTGLTVLFLHMKRQI